MNKVTQNIYNFLMNAETNFKFLLALIFIKVDEKDIFFIQFFFYIYNVNICIFS